jgi:hypothetical protein
MGSGRLARRSGVIGGKGVARKSKVSTRAPRSTSAWITASARPRV